MYYIKLYYIMLYYILYYIISYYIILYYFILFYIYTPYIYTIYIYIYYVQFSLRTCCLKDYEVSFFPPAHLHFESSHIGINFNWGHPKMDGHPMLIHVNPPRKGPRIIKQYPNFSVNPNKSSKIIQNQFFPLILNLNPSSGPFWTLAHL